MEGSRFTLSVIETMEADAGKYLANQFLVSYRDPTSGGLQELEGYGEGYAHVAGIWLPTSRTVVTIADSPTPKVRKIRFVKPQKLDAERAVAR